MDAQTHVAVPIRPRPSAAPTSAALVDPNTLPVLPKALHPEPHLPFAPAPVVMHPTGPVQDDQAAPTASTSMPPGPSGPSGPSGPPAPPEQPLSPTRMADRSRLTKFYHFLCSIPVMTLRRIAKEWGRKQYGLKKVLVARIYLFVLGKVEVERRALDEVLATSAKMPDFEAFITDARMGVLWDSAPSKAELQRTIGDAAAAAPDHDPAAAAAVAADPHRQHSLSPSPSPPPFPDTATLPPPEAARLVLLIRSDHAVKHALRISQPPDDQTVHTTWQKVECRFNDPSFRPVLSSVRGLSESCAADPAGPSHVSSSPSSPVLRPDVDYDAATRPALYRTAAHLAEHFSRVRPIVAAYVDRWRRRSARPAGSPVPAAIFDVLPRAPTGDLAPIGALVLAIFRALEPWTPVGDADARMLGLSGRMGHPDTHGGIPGSASAGATGSGGGGGGIVGAGSRRILDRLDDEETDGGSDLRPIRTKRRRRGGYPGMGGAAGATGVGTVDGAVAGSAGGCAVGDEDEEYRGEFLRGVGHALRLVGSRRGSERSEAERARAEEKLNEEVRLTQLQIQTHLIKSMAEARRLLQEHDDDAEFKGMLQHYYASLKDEYLKPHK